MTKAFSDNDIFESISHDSTNSSFLFSKTVPRVAFAGGLLMFHQGDKSLCYLLIKILQCTVLVCFYHWAFTYIG